MWHAITQFFLQLRAQGLSHEAVIEIMVALLGVMLAAVALALAGLTLAVAVVAWFGYSAIKKEAALQAKKEARRVAQATSAKIYRASMVEDDAAEYAESQKDVDNGVERSAKNKAPLNKKRGRKPATTDSGLVNDGRGADDERSDKSD